MRSSRIFSVSFVELSTLFTSFLFILTFISVQGQGRGNTVTNPAEFEWIPMGDHFYGVMEVGEATFTLNNGETLTTRAYRQQGKEFSIPGPTIRVVPGNKYILSFHNLLPYEPKSTAHNVFKDPNVSNIHTHGLHISGESPGDDVTRSFEGGFGGDFVYDIPPDHMGGTYWYHAHHHGSTFLQVSGGMFGLLIVDDDNGDQIPVNVSNMEERNIIFGFLDPAAAGTGGDTLLSGTLSSTWTVNGLVEGDIYMPTNTWERWRVLLADRAANMKSIEFGPGVEVMLLARDGVWRTVAPKELTSNILEMTGASRADFAIKTSSDSWVKIDGTIVANIKPNGASNTNPTASPFDDNDIDQNGSVITWSADRPHYLRDLRGESNVNQEAVSMGARTINGGKFDINEATFTLPATQVQEWSLSGAVQHPFHLHVYHVQALEDGNDFEAGEYYDVISSKMSVRFDLNQNTSTVYQGMTILHCHILSHEDRGAMGWLDVQGGIVPPEFPVGSSYSEYYPLNVQQPPSAPTNLVASNPTSSSIDLNWVDNSNDEDYFDIERGIDGINFAYINSVGTDVVSFTDSGLTPSTAYFYRVKASNISGESVPTNVAAATTLPSSGDIEMHLESITLNRDQLKGNRVRAIATIRIVDKDGQAVSGATVSGDFTGLSSSSESGTTDINGEVLFNSRALKNPEGLWCFTVTNVVLTGANYITGVITECENNPVTQNSRSSSILKTITGATETNLYIYPNPFREKINISFQIHQQSHTKLELYTILGERVFVITDRIYDAGRYTFEWKANNLSSGMYFLKFKAGDLTDTRRLMLIR